MIIIIIIIIIILLISCRFGNFFYIFGNWLFASFLHQITEILNFVHAIWLDELTSHDVITNIYGIIR